jgi:hypothetical protein
LLFWRERRRDRYLLLSALLTGLCLTNHLTSGLLLPAALLFVGLVERRKLLDWRLMLKAAGLFFLGLTPYLYLPVRSWMNAPFEGNNPGNLERFWYVVSGGNLTGTFFAFGPAELLGRLAFYWGHLMDNMNPLVVMVALAGAAAMFFRDRRALGSRVPVLRLALLLPRERHPGHTPVLYPHLPGALPVGGPGFRHPAGAGRVAARRSAQGSCRA